MKRCEHLAPAIPESTFQRSVLELGRALGWRCHAGPLDQRRCDGAGYPDVVMARPPRLLYAELKTNVGKLSPAQKEWIADLKGCPGAEVYVWRPADMDDIVNTLQRR